MLHYTQQKLAKPSWAAESTWDDFLISRWQKWLSGQQSSRCWGSSLSLVHGYLQKKLFWKTCGPDAWRLWPKEHNGRMEIDEINHISNKGALLSGLGEGLWGLCSTLAALAQSWKFHQPSSSWGQLGPWAAYHHPEKDTQTQPSSSSALLVTMGRGPIWAWC